MFTVCYDTDMASLEMSVLKQNYDKDQYRNKVNLGIIEHVTDLGITWALRVVRTVEKFFQEKPENITCGYLNPLGFEAFTTICNELILGKDSPAIIENRSMSVQVLGRMGGLRITAEFLRKVLNYDTVYFSLQMDSTHRAIFKRAGFTNIKYYKYWNNKTKNLHLDALIRDLRHAPPNAVVHFYCSGHYPTGCDPTKEEWCEIADVMEEQNLFPLFDCPFVGICSGDYDEDAWPVRYFVSRGFELICAQSFSYNFCVHNYCTENLTIVAKSNMYIPKIKSHVIHIISTFYMTPPAHGAFIISKILDDGQLRYEWKESLKSMAGRLKQLREVLREALESIDTPGDWSHITTQTGMFCYSGLNQRQIHYLNHKHHIYMQRSGRINICGLSLFNTQYIAQAIKDAVTSVG